MFTYRKEITSFMQRKKVQYFCIKPLLFLWCARRDSNSQRCRRRALFYPVRLRALFYIRSVATLSHAIPTPSPAYPIRSVVVAETDTLRTSIPTILDIDDAMSGI